ncbi:anthranilate phosphoribosyltransferase [Opitutus terrae]|uniref:Anthranilate phosphoribosyltransferase n=1 Tax=Opitutus terrae (strain DSM 11246 / JCM 15787 / PB90-1) TaxID=452637 RepID=B1ZWC2_OPITP|nr:anthranilate phosphoribosyltransferase [Opitutus terrae]ACB76874.1 anthranilate phosphoribosyltransferase [Opitutus terrae PB90-1]
MPQLAELTTSLVAGQNLGPAEVESAALALMETEETDEAKTAFLAALAAKGETADEVAGFARAFLARAVNPGVEKWAPQAIDIVGTGGDHAGGFNISSLVVLVLASAGVKVMKHGNRGITSKCGSADLLAGLGVTLDAPLTKIRHALDELGFVFFFAPAYHPAFRHIAPARKALAAQGKRSVFNILGPLINPGRPAHSLIGVFSQAWVPKLAAALDALGTRAGLAVHGVIDPQRGIDELTTATPNLVRGAGRLRDVNAEWNPADFGLRASPFAELQGGDLATNLAITQAVLAGRGPTGLVDTIAFNAAVCLWIVGKTGSVKEGVPIARDLLLGGAVAEKISATREFYAS